MPPFPDHPADVPPIVSRADCGKIRATGLAPYGKYLIFQTDPRTSYARQASAPSTPYGKRQRSQTVWDFSSKSRTCNVADACLSFYPVWGNDNIARSIEIFRPLRTSFSENAYLWHHPSEMKRLPQTEAIWNQT